jgi:PAS domain S-box-containing protein
MEPTDFDLRQFFVRSHEALIVVDALTSQIVLFNPAAEALFGYPTADALSLLIDDLLPPRVRPLYRERLAKYQTTGHAPVIDAGRPAEMPMLTRAGVEIPVELTLTAIQARQGRGRYVLAVIRDAAERRRTARERERRLRSEVARAEAETARQQLLGLLDGLSASLWEADVASGRFVFLSQRTEALLGYPRQRWLDEPDFWLTCILPEDRAAVQAIVDTVIADGQGRNVEMRVTAADGRELTLRGVIDIGEQAAGAGGLLRGVLLDVTGQKQAEGALHFLAEASRVLGSAVDLDGVLQALVRVVVPVLADWATVTLSQETGEVQRAARRHRERQGEALLDALHANYPLDPAGPHPVAQVLRTGGTVFLPQVTDADLRSAAQDATHLRGLQQLVGSLIIVPLRVGGRRIGALTLTRTPGAPVYSPTEYTLALDLADRAASVLDKARLYEAERAARAEAEAALAVREQFLSVAAHELRTPLATVKASLQLIAKRLPRRAASGELSDLLAMVDTGMDRLTRLVRDLIDVARLSREGFALDPQPVDIGALVERTVVLERAVGPQRAIELSRPAQPLVVMTDAERLQQVLENLLQNARKYSPADTPIGVRVEVEAQRALIAVSDQGIGIPPEEQGRIFERFHRAGNVDANVAGLGIGLFVAQEIMRAHGGEVRVASQPGAGSTFTLVLPLHSARHPASWH